MPLAVMESNDGREYYNMKALIPEIPPYKYQVILRILVHNICVEYVHIMEILIKMCG